jgi:hypothetical protein
MRQRQPPPPPDRVERLTLYFGPWLFAAIVVGGFIAGITEFHGMTFGDYVQAVAAGAGLVAVSHGIHRGERLRRGGVEVHDRDQDAS